MFLLPSPHFLPTIDSASETAALVSLGNPGDAHYYENSRNFLPLSPAERASVTHISPSDIILVDVAGGEGPFHDFPFLVSTARLAVLHLATVTLARARGVAWVIAGGDRRGQPNRDGTAGMAGMAAS